MSTRAAPRTSLFSLALFVTTAACSSGSGTSHTSTGAGGHASTSSASTSSGGAGGGAPAFNVDDISKAPGAGVDAEPTIAVGKNGVVGAAWIASSNKPAVAYTFSTDGGMTWGPPQIASPNDALGYGDPTMVSGSDGSMYLSFVGFDMAFTKGNVLVEKAAPGATTFGTPVKVSDPANAGPYDKPVMAMTNGQVLVVSYTDITANQIVLARSTDGATFTRTPVPKSSNGSLSTPCPAVGGGRLWVVFGVGTTTQLRWSDDDGATFPAANASRVSPSTDTDVSAEDPVCVGQGNDVWVMYGRSHDKLDPSAFNYLDYALRLAHSSDGGATFGAVQDVEDTAASKLYMEPALVLEPSGTIDLAYYAGNLANDPAGSFRLARSKDSGQTFAPSTPIATPFFFSGARSSAQWAGDYSTVVASQGRLYAAYSHNVTAPAHISFASVPLP